MNKCSVEAKTTLGVFLFLTIHTIFNLTIPAENLVELILNENIDHMKIWAYDFQ